MTIAHSQGVSLSMDLRLASHTFLHSLLDQICTIQTFGDEIIRMTVVEVHMNLK